MRGPWKKKKRGLVVLLCVLCLCVTVLVFTTRRDDSERFSTSPYKSGSPSFLLQEDRYLHELVKKAEREEPVDQLRQRATAMAADGTVNNDRCTMRACFDLSRCLNGFKVFVYPSSGQRSSTLYRRILRVVKNSHYYTYDPAKACLFLPSLDTLDRDQLSKDYVRGMNKMITQLEHWNGGKNHLILNLYSGSWPTYSQELDFPYGKAIIAKSSFSDSSYRPGFDISIPLMHKNHREKAREKGLLRVSGNLLPVWRKYLVVFKGKRYLHGIGSETRNALYHLHNGRDILILTTCKHGRDWGRLRDDRCDEDNRQYER